VFFRTHLSFNHIKYDWEPIFFTKGVFIMATHNQVRIVGYLIKEPKIKNEGIEGEEKFIAQIRTTRRDIEGFNDDRFADLILFYDGTELMPQLKTLRRFDLIDVKGVFNIIPTPKKHFCEHCGAENIKYNTRTSAVYPIDIERKANFQDYYEQLEIMPNKILEDNYREVSNQCLLLGTVVTDPELIQAKNGRTICRYAIGVDRKYYIKSQDMETCDYPWVYEYGHRAQEDYDHLIKNESLILLDGFIHNKKLTGHMTCSECGNEFTYTDVGTQFTPYSVEYMSGYKTDEDIEREKENERRRNI